MFPIHYIIICIVAASVLYVNINSSVTILTIPDLNISNDQDVEMQVLFIFSEFANANVNLFEFFNGSAIKSKSVNSYQLKDIK